MIEVHALHASIYVECDVRTSFHAVAQSILTLADRNLLRCKDAANRLSRILGISLARAPKSLALSQMDRRDGALCKARCKKDLVLLSVSGRDGAFQHHTDFSPFAC